MHTSPPHRKRCVTRLGFSIVEVIVALMIVTVGLLGIAGATALALRNTLDATRRRDAAERAQSHLSLLVAAGCGRATSGRSTDVQRQLTEQWTVRSVGAFQQVTDSVTWVGASGNGTFSLTTAALC
jgi:Tfp pilus assembly protein PilV